MIQVSDAYKELVEFNIRPKAEPIIKVSGKDNNENDIELVWNAKNIKDLKYKRKIDPIGRELPYMELTWTEIYTGKLNAESYPEKYNNIVKYMMVDFSVVQNLEFYSTWKTLFNSAKTWKELFAQGVSWKELKSQVSQEIIKPPKMFLTAKPTIQGQTITWVARDLLYFLDEVQTKAFYGKDFIDDPDKIHYLNPFIYVLVNERGRFTNNENVFNSIQNSILLLNSKKENIDQVGNNLEENVVLDGQTKDILGNYASIKNYYWDFSSNEQYSGCLILKQKDFSTPNPPISQYSFTNNILYDYPKITNGTNISAYNFKNYKLQKTDETYTKYPDSVYEFEDKNGTKLPIYRWNFEGYGERENDEIADSEINYCIGIENELITIKKLSLDNFDNSFYNNTNGDVFVEDNTANPYDESSVNSKNRFDYLNGYFNENQSILEFEALPNLSLETGDIVDCETNLYTNDNNIIKTGIIVGFDLSYSGAIKQKFIVHEVTNCDN